MTDKTCGTCDEWARVSGSEGVCGMQGVAGDADDRDNYLVTSEGDPCCSPGYYCKRGDSVERVALDMLVEIDMLASLCKHGSCRETVAMMHRGAFADRLPALGVVE